MADVKSSSLRFCQAVHAREMGHFWGSLADFAASPRKNCKAHEFMGLMNCSQPVKPGTIDLCWGSGPCQPFSPQKRKSTPAEDHCQHDTTMSGSTGIPACIAAILPLLFATAQVMGFERTGRRSTRYVGSTPLELFIQEVYASS